MHLPTKCCIFGAFVGRAIVGGAIVGGAIVGGAYVGRAIVGRALIVEHMSHFSEQLSAEHMSGHRLSMLQTFKALMSRLIALSTHNT